MLTANEIFFPDIYGTELYDSRKIIGLVTPEVIDFEMQYFHDKIHLKLISATQEGLEYFVSNYGSDYEVLYLYDCRRIKDFSPLARMKKLRALRIEWCRKIDKLWDLSLNPSLKILELYDAKRICENPIDLQKSSSLESVRLCGNMERKYELESMEYFRGMPSIKRIDLNYIRLKNKDMDILDSLPALEEFHFDAGMLTTEEIAWICARYPHLKGESLGAYSIDDVYHDIRVCGANKPGLELPKGQKKLDKYIAEFNALVENYRREL